MSFGSREATTVWQSAVFVFESVQVTSPPGLRLIPRSTRSKITLSSGSSTPSPGSTHAVESPQMQLIVLYPIAYGASTGTSALIKIVATSGTHSAMASPH